MCAVIPTDLVIGNQIIAMLRQNEDGTLVAENTVSARLKSKNDVSGSVE